jgi:hypothetical protein
VNLWKLATLLGIEAGFSVFENDPEAEQFRMNKGQNCLL